MKNLGLIWALALGCGAAADGPFETLDPAIYADPAWDCLAAPAEMAPRNHRRIQYVLPVIEFGSELRASAVPDLEVAVCGDVDCSLMLPRCADIISDGCYGLSVGPQPFMLQFDFPFGAGAGLRLKAPGYVSVDYQLGGPMVGTPDGFQRVIGNAVPMVREADSHRFYSGAGRGAVLVTALDCNSKRAAGVSLLPIDGTPLRVEVNGNVVAGSLQTDMRGVVGFGDLGPGSFTIEAATPVGLEIIAEAIVRPDSITMFEARHGRGVWGQ